MAAKWADNYVCKYENDEFSLNWLSIKHDAEALSYRLVIILILIYKIKKHIFVFGLSSKVKWVIWFIHIAFSYIHEYLTGMRMDTWFS